MSNRLAYNADSLTAGEGGGRESGRISLNAVKQPPLLAVNGCWAKLPKRQYESEK